MNFNNVYESILEKINLHMESYFNTTSNKYTDFFNEVVNYSLLAKGKRIRPILLMKTGLDLGLEEKILIEFACALEMIHTYSLIHDDLPSMDDDDYRRGMLTSHVKYSEAMAILAGDALLNKAFETVLKCSIDNTEHSQKIIKASYELAKASSDKGMIIGQVGDIESEGLTISKNDMEFIIANKTTKLIVVAGSIPSILSGMDEYNNSLLEKLFYNIGFSFQIKDDILDVTVDSDTLGKTAGKDTQSNKNTYVSMHGLENAKNDLYKMIEESKQIINKLDFLDKDFFMGLLDLLIERNK
jgi:geranylgeranyl diphosphate synthase type II